VNTALTGTRHHVPGMARTILVVEDETTLRETLIDALETEGFRVVGAADGRAALAEFRAEAPDLILLDVMLPELSGVEVCRIIRAESPVPIIMLTARDSELDKVVGWSSAPTTTSPSPSASASSPHGSGRISAAMSARRRHRLQRPRRRDRLVLPPRHRQSRLAVCPWTSQGTA